MRAWRAEMREWRDPPVEGDMFGDDGTVGREGVCYTQWATGDFP